MVDDSTDDGALQINFAYELAAGFSSRPIFFMDAKNKGDEKTLLEWAAQRCPDTPRKRIKEWIRLGRFCLDGEVATKAGLRLNDPGERLVFGQREKAAAKWGNRQRIHPKLVLVHLDDSIAIVDKEAGLLSVPTENQSKVSAMDVLSNYLNNPKGEVTRRTYFGSAAKVRPLPVHRLDQYTSGLLCVAMTADARAHLIGQLRERKFLREYLAYADGLTSETSGVWRDSLRLDEQGYTQEIVPAGTPGATDAVTWYRVESVFSPNNVSKLRIRLETGLKHQIRIQAAAHKMPLLGDRRYHPATLKAMSAKGAKIPYNFRRQALHASTIGIKHPKSGVKMRFQSRIPGDMQALELRLGGACSPE